ncbi:MAG: hypothetical protein FJZ01_17340 [Candidatus Sericytochromatia bacterium]|nr:hypothetical protein [Candidatus Tanganyikabacteria bacterium]
MPSLNFNYRDKPTEFEMGAVGRTAKRGMLGGVLGGAAGGALVLAGIAGGPVVWGLAVIGALGGAVWGMKSSDPQKIQNRPVQINHPLWGNQKVYISAEQWGDIKGKLAGGVNYEEFNTPDLQKQFEGANPPAAEKP